MTNATSKLKVQCKNIFKDSDNIRESLSSIWADIINSLENDRNTMYNTDLQSHAHQNLIDEVSGI